MHVETPQPEEYSEHYFLSDCGGFKEFLEGKTPTRHKKALQYLNAQPGEMILDIGCGRGELLRECSVKGADIVGIDYSSAAVGLSENLSSGAPVIQADARALPFHDETFDKIIMLDLAEHLSPSDFQKCLLEAKRVLRQHGQMLMHTPNLWGDRLFSFYYRCKAILRFRRTKSKTSKQTSASYSYSRFHVNVMSPISLKKTLHSAGFKSKIWFAGHPLQEVPRWWVVADKVLFFLSTMWCKAFKG